MIGFYQDMESKRGTSIAERILGMDMAQLEEYLNNFLDMKQLEYKSQLLAYHVGQDEVKLLLSKATLTSKQQAAKELQGMADVSPAKVQGQEQALERLRAQTEATAEDITRTKKALQLAQARLKDLEEKLFKDADIVTIDRTAYHSCRRLANKQAGPGYARTLNRRRGLGAGLVSSRPREGSTVSSSALG